MALRIVVSALLLGLATSGPVKREVKTCSRECPGADSKFQYSQKNSYVYSYEASNTLQMEQSSDLSSLLKTTITVIPLSRCEMTLQVSDAKVKHGSLLESSSPEIERLKRHDLRFSWQDGKIDSICPHPDDSEDIINIKRGMLSTFQNSMKTLAHDSLVRETDVLGTCDTEYKITELGIDKTVIYKTKNLPSCYNHVKGRSGFTALSYSSPNSPFQHLPFMSDRNYTCQQTVIRGVTDEVVCVEQAYYKPLASYGYVVKADGKVTLKLLSTKPAANEQGIAISDRKSLILEYNRKTRHHEESEARTLIKSFCSKAGNLLPKDVGLIVHQLVGLIRGLSATSVQNLYDSLRAKELCESNKVLDIFLDSLKAASSAGAIEVLTKLVISHELSNAETMLWLAAMPFVSDPDDGAVQAAEPLLSKEFGSTQALLSVSSLAHKYCLHHEDCESKPGVQKVISTLQTYLGNNCQGSGTEEDENIITALKAFGNLGYHAGSNNLIFKCATTASNSIPVRIAAIDAFRRSPCSEEISSKLLAIYENVNDDDEIRIAAVIGLSHCPSPPIIYRISKTYNDAEKSKQVEVFTWTYLKNLRETSDPLKQKAKNAAWKLHLHVPHSVDITKFSRNFELSNFAERLNLGYSVEGNLIHSQDSFLPRSGSLDLNVDIFGSQLNLLEVGMRVENLEHELEKLFGPNGMLQTKFLPHHDHQTNEVTDNGETYKARIQSLKDKVNLKPKHPPKGSFYFRILGNELRWRHMDSGQLQNLAKFDLNVKDLVQQLTKFNNVDIGDTFLFLDNTILIPSITGRGYKLAANGSVTLGLKADGKMAVRSTQFTNPQFDVKGRFQPSATMDIGATISIYSEDYEPSLKVNTILNAGHDFEINLDVNKGPSIVSKLNFPSQRNEIFSFKREFYQSDHEGEKILPKPVSHKLTHCTKSFLEDALGLRFCGSLSIPHVYNSDGKLKVPFTGPMEADLVMTKTDLTMTGYEFTLKLPESWDATVKEFQLFFDTPNSAKERKFNSELSLNTPNDGTNSANFKFYCPYYTFQADATYISNSDKLEMKLDALGDGKRQYKAALTMEKDVKGARLAEYRPILSVELPWVSPLRFQGTLIFAKGRKEQVSFTIKSDSFEDEFMLKGNIAKEGILWKMDSEFQLISNVTINVFAETYKLHTAYKRVATDVDLELGFDYYHKDSGPQSAKFKIGAHQVHIGHPLRFILETESLSSEYPDFNTKLRWDLSAQINEHLKNDILLRYGKDFKNDQNLIHFTQLNKLSGQFYDFKKMNFENKLGLRIPALNFDKSLFFTTVWEFSDKPKLLIDIGVKMNEGEYVKVELNYESYNSLVVGPIKMIMESKLIYYRYEFSIRGEIQQTSSNIIQGRTVIQSQPGKQLTADYIYSIRSTDQVFYHEFECTLVLPGSLVPIQQKLYLKRSQNIIQFGSQTDTGNQSPYVVDLKLNTDGPSELVLDLPVLEGKLKIDRQRTLTKFEGDFKTPGRRITGTGKFVPGDTNNIEFEILWDADKDSHQKIVFNAKSDKQNGERTITGHVDYAGSVSIDINGKMNELLLFGPHEIRADFSGNMEPMSIVFTYELSKGSLNSVLKYLRNDAEKLRADLKGKLIRRAYHFDFEGGLLLTSPYRAFNGKEIYYRIYLDSNDATRSFLTEYRLKQGPTLGYVSKVDYKRKRSWPGQIKYNALMTANQKTVYEASSTIEYGGGKYSIKTSFVPSPGKKLNLDTSMEIAARYAAFHHSLSTTLQHLQLFRINAVGDLRNGESYKIESNFDVNAHKLYDLNATLSTRSVTDFEGKILLFGKFIPSLHVFSKAQNTNSLTKYNLNVEKDSKEILSGKGEIRKRKRGFNGDIVFNYRGKDFLTVDVSNEVKSQRERNYVIKLTSLSKVFTVSVHWLKEKKTVKQTIALCRNEYDNCITVASTHKQEDGKNEWKISYKRADVELNLDRITEDSDTTVSRRTVLYSGNKRYGYDFKYGTEGDLKNLYLALILPAREISINHKIGFSLKKPSLHTELRLDAEHNPDRKLSIEISADNELATDLPSELHIIVNHPVLEKKIAINAVANYDSAKSKFFEADLVFDYSLTPADKIVAKLTLQKPEQKKANVFADLYGSLKIYHEVADEDHWDFTLNSNFTSNGNETLFAMKWLWKDADNKLVDSLLLAKKLHNEQAFRLVYHRPKLDFEFNATSVLPSDLHETSAEIDFAMLYNGEVTKAKLIIDGERACRKLSIMGLDGEPIRKVELCVDVGNPLLFSLKTTSLEDGMWVFDYSLEIIRKGFATLNIRHHWNPEFVGGLIFQLTKLSGDLMDAGLGQLPISSSPRYKTISNTWDAKVNQPLKLLMTEEYKKMSKEFLDELQFFQEKAIQYYHMLPSLSTLQRLFEPLKPWFKEKLEETYDLLEKFYDDLIHFYENLVVRGKELTVRLKERCSAHSECLQAMNAVTNTDIHSFQQLIEKLIARLPENFRKYFESGGKIETWLRETYSAIEPHIETLMDTEYAKEAMQYFFKMVQQLRIQYAKSSLELKRLYKRKKEQLLQSENFKKFKEVYQTGVMMFVNEIREFNYEKWWKKFKPILEEYLTRVKLPSLQYFFKINSLDGERGVLDLDINLPLDVSVLKTLVNFIHSRTQALSELSYHLHWKTLLIKLKKISDLNFVPPYKEQALLLGQHHYITFDKTFYDFAGECAYLLASDLEDGNFSVFLTPTFSLNPADTSGPRQLSLGFLVNNTAVLINLSDKTVKAGNQLVDLPYLSRDFTVTREDNTIVIDDHYGVQVKCHVVYDVCSITLSGWYFGKTAGLSGTYDYEPSNDFKRPRGQIPNSVTVFAKSWDISKGCKTKNLIQEAKVNENSENYKLCKSYFGNSSSSLSACFSEVKPNPYLGLCYQYLSSQSDANKALCDVAMAYVMECERNFVELNLPPKCLSCEGPNGVKLTHGEKKKFQSKSDQKSSDVVYVVESHACNDRMVKDLDSLTRTLDRELQNEHFNDNRYGVVSYDNSGHAPLMYSARGKVLFAASDVAEIAKKIPTERKSNTSSSLDALRLAVTYPFRAGSSKALILMSCSACSYDYKSLQYPVLQQILLEHDIYLHVISGQAIRMKKASKEKDVIGADSNAVYHAKDVSQKELVGDTSLRAQISLPKDACVALSQDVGGSFFTTSSQVKDSKIWRSLFVRRVVKTSSPISCSYCDCSFTADHVSKVACQPCEPRKPSLPFSVCKNCHLPGLVTAFYSYVMHNIL